MIEATPRELLLHTILAALAGLVLGTAWYRHRRAIARARARWTLLAERRGWHVVERGGGFAVIGRDGQQAFHLSQGALAQGDLGIFLETRIDRSPWVVLEIFAVGSPIAYTARRPGERVRTGDDASQRRAAALCDAPLRAALAILPRPYLMLQNGILVLIWPWDRLPTDAHLDAALARLRALAAHAAPPTA